MVNGVPSLPDENNKGAETAELAKACARSVRKAFKHSTTLDMPFGRWLSKQAVTTEYSLTSSATPLLPAACACWDIFSAASSLEVAGGRRAKPKRLRMAPHAMEFHEDATRRIPQVPGSPTTHARASMVQSSLRRTFAEQGLSARKLLMAAYDLAQGPALDARHNLEGNGLPRPATWKLSPTGL